MTHEKLEGLSLALCVADILGGYVRENEVSRIFSSAARPTPGEFEDILETYTRSYWLHDREKGKSIARRFHDAGRIEFAGVQDCSNGHWRTINVVSALDIDARRRDRETLSNGVSLERAKMPVLRLKK